MVMNFNQRDSLGLELLAEGHPLTRPRQGQRLGRNRGDGRRSRVGRCEKCTAVRMVGQTQMAVLESGKENCLERSL
jgi:hypothetical protein